MSPLKVIALLNLRCTSLPFQGSTTEQATSNAMVVAYDEFAAQGLLVDGVTLGSAILGTAPFPALTAKGVDLVTRLCEVEP